MKYDETEIQDMKEKIAFLQRSSAFFYAEKQRAANAVPFNLKRYDSMENECSFHHHCMMRYLLEFLSIQKNA